VVSKKVVPKPMTQQMTRQMTRGDIVLADLAPTVGSEADKRRPVVIVSNNGANRAAQESGRGVITVIPLTSQVATVHLFQVLITAAESGLRVDSKVQTEQISSISPARISTFLGRVPDHRMTDVEQALRYQLDL
jgi:mRNA interferase MazF